MARVLCRAMVGQRPGAYHGRDSRCLPVQAGSYRFSCHFSTNDGEYDYRNPSVGIEFILTEKGRSRLSRLHVIWVLMGPLSSMIPSGDGRLTISCPSARTSIQGIPLGSPMRCAWAASCARAVSRSATHNRAAMSPYVGTAEVLPSAGTFGRRNGVICCAVILAGTILSACDWNELIGRAYY